MFYFGCEDNILKTRGLSFILLIHFRLIVLPKVLRVIFLQTKVKCNFFIKILQNVVSGQALFLYPEPIFIESIDYS
jgi:hypothetical protein